METARGWDRRTVRAESILFGGIRPTNRRRIGRESPVTKEGVGEFVIFDFAPRLRDTLTRGFLIFPAVAAPTPVGVETRTRLRVDVVVGPMVSIGR